MDSGSETLKRLKQKKCRICLSEQNLTPLFRRGLGLKVMQLADIKIYEGDGLPTTICMDCELEVKRCHNFVAQIKRADAKLREMLENGEDSSEISEKEREVVGSNDSEVSDCQIDIEECNVKQEAYPFDHLIDEKAEIHSNSDNDHLYETEDNNDQMEDETEFNQINHVDVVECSDTMATEGMEVSEDPLGEESLIDTQKSLKTECETTADPLTCMKQENLESMDVDKGTSVAATLSPQPLIAAPPTPQPSTSSSVVNTSEAPILLKTPQLKKIKYKVTKQLVKRKTLTKCNDLSSLCKNTSQKITEYTGMQTSKKESNNVTRSSTAIKKSKQIFKKSKISTDVLNQTLATNKEYSRNISCLKGLQTNTYNNFCVICKMSFTCFDKLKKHRETKGLICRVCTAQFERHIELEAHFVTHNTTRCKVCKEEFYTMKELITHKAEMHAASTVQCKYCLKLFTTRYGLSKHVKLFHDEGELGCDCVVCGKMYKCSFQLKQHLSSCHTAYEAAECNFCHLILSSPFKLQTHIKTLHLDTEDNLPASCPTCKKVFNRATLLANHLETHENTETECNICGKLIKTKSLMKSHMQMQHSKTGTFTCKICNEHFGVQKELRMHQRKHHQKQTKTWFCEICGKVYKNRSTLKWHMVVHTDERPFKCEICDATFKMKLTLKTHRRVHSDIGKYTCNGCGMTFKWKQTYDKHLSKCESGHDVGL